MHAHTLVSKCRMAWITWRRKKHTFSVALGTQSRKHWVRQWNSVACLSCVCVWVASLVCHELRTQVNLHENCASKRTERWMERYDRHAPTVMCGNDTWKSILCCNGIHVRAHGISKYRRGGQGYFHCLTEYGGRLCSSIVAGTATHSTHNELCCLDLEEAHQIFVICLLSFVYAFFHLNDQLHVVDDIDRLICMNTAYSISI